MISQENSSSVVQAHACVTKAENYFKNREWENAIEEYTKASELFLKATNDTSDIESIKALKLLSISQINKANEIKKQLPFLKNINTTQGITIHDNSNNNLEKSSNFSKEQEIKILHDPLVTIPLEGSQNFFIGQKPSDSTDEILFFPNKFSPPSNSIATIPITENNVDNYNNEEKYDLYNNKKISENDNSTTNIADFWYWMEKMLDILPKPILNTFSSQKNENVSTMDESTLMNSFLIVNPQKNSIYDSPILENHNGDSKIKKLENQINYLQKMIKDLTVENTNLKKFCQQRIQLNKENDFLKQSIVNFRNEVTKKANQFRNLSQASSVGNLPSLLVNIANTNKVQELEMKIKQMNNQIKELQEKCSKQEEIIHEYEKKFGNLNIDKRNRASTTGSEIKKFSYKNIEENLHESLSSKSTSIPIKLGDNISSYHSGSNISKELGTSPSEKFIDLQKSSNDFFKKPSPQ
jgi:hypothetical protein